MKRKSLSCFTESLRQTQYHSTQTEESSQQRAAVDSPTKEGFSKKNTDNFFNKDATKGLNLQNELCKVSPRQQTGCFLKRMSLQKTGPNWMIVGKNSGADQTKPNQRDLSLKNIPREQSLNSSVKNANAKRSFHLSAQPNTLGNAAEDYFKRTDVPFNLKQQSSEKSQSIISLVTSSSSFTSFPNPTTPVQFINPKHILRSDAAQPPSSTKQVNTNQLRPFPLLSKRKLSANNSQQIMPEQQPPNNAVFQSINSDLKLSAEESMMFRGRQRSNHSPIPKHSLSPLNKLTYSPNKKARTLNSFWCEQICLSSFPSNTPKSELAYNIQPYPSNPTISIQALTPSNNRQSMCLQTSSMFSPKKHRTETPAAVNPISDLSVGLSLGDSNNKSKLNTTVLFISKKHKDCSTLCSPQDKDVIEVKISPANALNTQNTADKQQGQQKIKSQSLKDEQVPSFLPGRADQNRDNQRMDNRLSLGKTSLMDNEVAATSKEYPVAFQSSLSYKPGYPVQQQYVLQTFLQMKNIKLRSRNKVISNTLKQQLFPEKGLEKSETTKNASFSPKKQHFCAGSSNFKRKNEGGYDGKIVSEGDFQNRLDKEESPQNKSIDNEEDEDFYNYTQGLKNACKDN